MPVKVAKLSIYGVIRSPSKLPVWSRIRFIGAGFQGLMMNLHPNLLIYETVELHKSAAGSAAMRKGHLTQVAELIGYLNCLWDRYVHRQISVTRSLEIYEEPHELYPRQWKGNLPKNIARVRINKAFQLELGSGIEEHIADAIGIGDAYLKKIGFSTESRLDIKNQRKDIAAAKGPAPKVVLPYA